MRRFAAFVFACSALVIGSGVTVALGEDYSCPPGAKFCPAPGSGQSASMDAPFGIDGGSFGNPQFASHANQLNEGEKLIMVAPTSGMGMPIMEDSYGGSPMMVSASSYDSGFGGDSYGTTASYAATPAFNAAPAYEPAPTYSSGPASVYASAPASGGMDMDFIPPPPGSPRPASSSASFGGMGGMGGGMSQSATVYEAPSVGASSSYASAPMRQEETLYQVAQAYQPAPAPVMAAEPRVASAPVRRPARESVKVSGPAARVEPTDSPLKPSPKSFAQASRSTSSYDAYDSDEYESRPAKKSTLDKPAKKKRADVLSEVANETSRKSERKPEKTSSSKSDRDRKEKKKDKKAKASSDDRIPWWKGGMWRNRNR